MFKYILLTVLILSGATSAQAEPTPDEATEGRNNYARLQLAAANAPGDLVSDAFIVEMMHVALQGNAQDPLLDPELREEITQARDRLEQRVAAGIKDEPVLLVTVGNCHGRYVQDGDCDAHWARVAELAGDDGYLHFLVMNHAAALGDDVLFARHAALAAQAETFESTLAAIFAPLYERYLQVPESLWPTDQDLGSPRFMAGVTAMANTAAFALPGYQSVMRYCEAAAADQKALCVAVARRLAADSSTMTDRMVGTAMLRKLGTDEEKAWAQQQRRQDQWLSRGLWGMEDELDETQNNRYFEVLAEHGEMAAVRYGNLAQGRSLEPPADWQAPGHGADAN